LAPGWNLLLTFIVEVEQSGFTRAAEFSNLSQPTTGRALKGLEEAPRSSCSITGRGISRSVGESMYRENKQRR
jgi:hypothetical protein